MKKISFFLIVFFIIIFKVNTYAQVFNDVPRDHWAYTDIHELRMLGITDGVGGNDYGMGLTITRAQFVTFLANLLEWDTNVSPIGSYTDNMDTGKWYYKYIEAGVYNGTLITETDVFRPDEPVTRAEMAVTIIRALGYDEAAKQFDKLGSPFSDVTEYQGHIAMAKDFGIIAGTGGDRFSPDDSATREQAAVMVMRMYRGLNKTFEYNGFYAIRSASQMDFINELSYASFGWSKLEISNGVLSLNTSASNNNEYNVPDGYRQPYEMAAKKLLMIACEDRYTDSGLPVSTTIATSQHYRDEAVMMIASAVNGIETDDGLLVFDGVVLDLENMKGEASKNGYNQMIKALKNELSKNNKLLFVAVPPPRRPGLEYFDGYDYKTIAESADKIILMAHDYNAKRLTDAERSAGMTITPLSPIDEIYYALKVLTDQVADRDKIMLQISFDTAQFKISNNVVQNERPYTPDYLTLKDRMMTSGVKFNYSQRYESPYITFYNSNDATDNIVWYEDERSVGAKLRMAGLINIKNISLWRLGTIPDYPNPGKDIKLDILNMLKTRK